MTTKTAIATPFRLDLRGEICPAPFIKTKLKIESLPTGAILEVTVDGEAIETIPRGMKEDGHKIVAVEREDNGVFRFYIQKSDDI
ncbi:MAG: sulfurtransferase TusA family protein [bacterium]